MLYISQCAFAPSAASSSACVGVRVLGWATLPISAPSVTGAVDAELPGAAAVWASESTSTRDIGERNVSFCVPAGNPLRARM